MATVKSVIRVVAGVVAAMCLTVALASAQAAGTVSGKVSDRTGPVPGALVELETVRETRTTTTGPDGTFTFTGLPAGEYHLNVRAGGYLTARADVTVGAATPSVEVTLSQDPHYSEVISVSPDARSVFDSYQPTSVLGGQDLALKLQGTVAATLLNEPGVTQRAFGPGPARPVIRGLDGDRVLVLEDGKRMGDLSSQSGDHGVNLNPSAASSIEVVRGPATLLYGANAIGGLINVITNSIPTAPVAKPTGTVTADLASSAGEAGASGSITAGRGPLAVHFSANGRRAGDYTSPDGDVPNSFSRGGAVEGAVSFVKANGFLGASVGHDKTRYGIPLVEDGETNLNPSRTTFDIRGERRNLAGPFDSLRVSLGVRRYEHSELDGDEVVTTFTNNSSEFELKANHRPAGRFKGTVGVQALTRAFEAVGEEALAPPVDQSGVAAFVYEEAQASRHLTLQFGGRVEHASFTPASDYQARSFTNVSGSFGLLGRPTDQTTIAISLARAARNPALEELYFRGPHPGSNAFENGDDSLESERALGFDASFRWQGSRASGEVTYFVNAVNNFIFRQFTGAVEDDLPETFFTQGDATLTGLESHVDIQASDVVWVEGGLDYVRGQLTSEDVPLPRMPPMRGRLGLRFKKDALQAGITGTFAGAQNRIFTTQTAAGEVGETATDGYSTLKLYAAYAFVTGATTHTLAARLDNAGNTRYQNHLNYLKDLVPEAGRDFRVTWTVAF